MLPSPLRPSRISGAVRAARRPSAVTVAPGRGTRRVWVPASTTRKPRGALSPGPFVLDVPDAARQYRLAFRQGSQVYHCVNVPSAYPPLSHSEESERYAKHSLDVQQWLGAQSWQSAHDGVGEKWMCIVALARFADEASAVKCCELLDADDEVARAVWAEPFPKHYPSKGLPGRMPERLRQGRLAPALAPLRSLPAFPSVLVSCFDLPRERES